MLNFKKTYEIRKFWSGIKIRSKDLLLDEKLRYGVDYIFVVDPYVVIPIGKTFPIYVNDLPINSADLKIMKYEFKDTNDILEHPFIRAAIKKCINLGDRTLIVATVTTTEDDDSYRRKNELHDALINEMPPLNITIDNDEITTLIMSNGSCVKPPLTKVPYNIITRDIKKAVMPFWLTNDDTEESEEHFENISFFEKFRNKTATYVEDVEAISKEYTDEEISESVNSEEFEKFFDEMQSRLSTVIDRTPNAENKTEEPKKPDDICENTSTPNNNPEHDEFINNINNNVKDKLNDSDENTSESKE